MLTILLLVGCPKPSLANQVAAHAGDPYGVQQLDFSFVVEADGVEKVRRRHAWQPKAGVLDVAGPDIDVHFEGLHGASGLSAAVEEPTAHEGLWKQVAPSATPDDAATAWAWFVNDSYWLLAPAKVMDDGVSRTESEGVLELDFDGVGITPGDHYRLEVADGGRVTGWSYTLQSGREGSWTFEDEQRLGPLNLSLRRVNPEGTVIWFDDVVVK